MRDAALQPILTAGALIGESPAWDAATGRLLWCDIPRGVVHEAWPDGDGWRAGRSWDLGGPVGAVVPRRGGGFLAATGNRILAVAEDGTRETVASADFDAEGFRFNDGKIDPAGRFWVGTQTPTGRHASGGALFCLETDGTLNEKIADVTISNGLDWSPDARFFYYIDTPRLSVDVFDYDLATGNIANRRPLITLAPGEGRPDGMCVDGEGNLWVALFYAGLVRCYDAEGTLLREIATGVPETTSCAFGGADGRTLFVTTGSIEIPDWRALEAGFPVSIVDEAKNAPNAGDLFALSPGVSGPPARAWAG